MRLRGQVLPGCWLVAVEMAASTKERPLQHLSEAQTNGEVEDNEGDKGEAEITAKEIQFQAAKESGEDGAEFYLPRSDLS